jgi:hypothetical protein
MSWTRMNVSYDQKTKKIDDISWGENVVIWKHRGAGRKLICQALRSPVWPHLLVVVQHENAKRR